MKARCAELSVHQPHKFQAAEFWVGLVFLFVIIEGGIRKWFLPEKPGWLLPVGPRDMKYIVYLSKDIFFGALCLFTASRYSGPLMERYGQVLKFSLCMVLMGAMVSSIFGVDWAGAFLDLRSMVALPFLSFLAASRLTCADIRQVVRWIAFLSLVPAVLGVVQFMLPPGHVLNNYVDPYSKVITFEGRVRATGTFSFISGMASMSIVAVWAGMFLNAMAERKRDFVLGSAAVIAGLVCANTAIVRSGLFMSISLILGVLTLSKLKGRFVIPSVLVILTVMGMLHYSWEPEENIVNPYATLTTVVLERHAKSDSIYERVSGMAVSLFDATTHTPLGDGFGIGQVGGALLRTGKRQLFRYEHEFGRMVSEIGVIGLAGTLILRIWIIYSLFSVWMRLPEGPGRNGLLVCALTILIFLTKNNAFDHVASGFSWPLVALSIAFAAQQGTALKFESGEVGAELPATGPLLPTI